MKSKEQKEVTTLRLVPKIKYGLCLLSRKQRRNVTGVMNWLIDKELQKVKSLLDLDIDILWDVDEKKRIKLLAEHNPELLTYGEEVFLKEEIDADG